MSRTHGHEKMPDAILDAISLQFYYLRLLKIFETLIMYFSPRRGDFPASVLTFFNGGRLQDHVELLCFARFLIGSFAQACLFYSFLG